MHLVRLHWPLNLQIGVFSCKNLQLMNVQFPTLFQKEQYLLGDGLSNFECGGEDVFVEDGFLVTSGPVCGVLFLASAGAPRVIFLNRLFLFLTNLGGG